MVIDAHRLLPEKSHLRVAFFLDLRVMKRWLLLLYFPFSSYAQCDLELLEFDPVLGYVTVAFNSTDNCGGEGGPDGISEIQFGFQAVDEDCNAMNIGWDFPSGFSINDDSNHPGWIYSSTTNEWAANWTNLYDESLDPPYYTGDTISFPLFNQYQSDCVDGPYAGQMGCELEGVLNYWADEGYSIQAVIWQISYGPTMYASEGGWAEVGVNGDGTPYGTGLYEDLNFLDNWIVVGDCGAPIPEVIIDTVYVQLPPDTIIQYVELPPDTVVQFVELPPDTVVQYVELPPDTVVQYVEFPVNVYDTTYITITDTIIWEVDCATGEPCLEVIECPVYIPNGFTPDNDGVNDAWRISTPPDCWDNVRVTVYSRWGDVVWTSDRADAIWNGGYDKAFVGDDVYAYSFVARNVHTYRWVERVGHLVVLR